MQCLFQTSPRARSLSPSSSRFHSPSLTPTRSSNSLSPQSPDFSQSYLSPDSLDTKNLYPRIVSASAEPPTSPNFHRPGKDKLTQQTGLFLFIGMACNLLRKSESSWELYKKVTEVRSRLFVSSLTYCLSSHNYLGICYTWCHLCVLFVDICIQLTIHFIGGLLIALMLLVLALSLFGI